MVMKRDPEMSESFEKVKAKKSDPIIEYC